ncbi:MAG: efflux RND transporter permease subunit, partial [Xanthomonadales bacterium]|nr:efflux RND transporter permease subunit [Xanthomonadales bacterium]
WKGAYSLDVVSEEVKRVEDFVYANREKYQVEQIYSWFSEQGWAGTRLKLREPNPGILDYLRLRNYEDGLLTTQELAEMLREEVPKSARAELGFGGDGGGGGGSEEGIQFSLQGDSTEVLADLAESIIPILAQRPELRDVRVDTGDANSELTVEVDRERAMAYGFSADEVARYVGIALRGTPLREFRQNGAEIPVWVRFAGAQQFRVQDLQSLMLRRDDGTEVPIMSVVSATVKKGATQINRQSRQTALTIQANLAEDKTTEDARKAIQEVMDSVTLPDGYRHSLAGNFERNDEAGAQMARNTLVALLMVYIIMAALFESMLMPTAIITSIFFSALGVFWFFALTGTTFTIMASIGILVLMGVVVNNGIVMVEHVNTLRRGGMSRHDALVNGCRDRLRPILMTMGCAILGMVPISLSTTQIAGGLTYYPMARAIAGGLTFSTIVTLLFLPTIYAMLDDLGLATKRVLARLRPNQNPDTVAQS